MVMALKGHLAAHNPSYTEGLDYNGVTVFAELDRLYLVPNRGAESNTRLATAFLGIALIPVEDGYSKRRQPTFTRKRVMLG